MFMDVLIYVAVLAAGIGIGLWIGHKKAVWLDRALLKVTGSRDAVRKALADVKAQWGG